MSAITPAHATKPCAAKFARRPSALLTNDHTEIQTATTTTNPATGNSMTSLSFSSVVAIHVPGENQDGENRDREKCRRAPVQRRCAQRTFLGDGERARSDAQ